jgi:hypothetical protein
MGGHYGANSLNMQDKHSTLIFFPVPSINFKKLGAGTSECDEQKEGTWLKSLIMLKIIRT